MLQATVETRVRFAETDAMGVTYHGNYLPWFEMARVALLDQLGTPYRQLEQEGFLLPVLETGLTYHRPSRFDDRVRITVTLAEKPKARLKLTYQVERDGELLVEGFGPRLREPRVQGRAPSGQRRGCDAQSLRSLIS